ncbi:hypothetical protein RJO15_07830 [Herbaspirillum huttiense F1]|uniref:hypothetical protein n=1 Tax=Herbaspirillum huttiense TaxID=863372 RepID=UPI0028854304|nr:hypothetical protein [Herbaspirillum huttiense]MDT0355669.1 hypothetical protein [Herbaspirillum huttiense F1]
MKKRVVRVTITKEIEVELTPTVLGPMTEEQYLAEFNAGLFPVESMDDVIKYAGEMAARYGGGVSHDGLGLVGEHYVTTAKVPDVKFRELDEEVEVELIDSENEGSTS